ncbi:MAG: hypothetical protein PVJ27_01925 [Candidatus Brocadiaceae bacterium]|jgi:hypothetical protein
MPENRMKVLEMLAAGRVSVDEAEKLLAKLEPNTSPSGVPAVADAEAPVTMPAAERPVPKNPRYLRIMVESAGGDRVNVRIPTALIRTGIKLGALLPEKARMELNGKGIDLAALSDMDTEELVEALAALTVDVDSANGDQVRIFCE